MRVWRDSSGRQTFAISVTSEFEEEAEMDHPTFADNAFAAFLDTRLRERFPDPANIVGEDVPRAIAENFRVWLADPATRATHHPLELRELEEIMAIQWGITFGKSSQDGYSRRVPASLDATTHLSVKPMNSALSALAKGSKD
jgi:hypothetical protein